MEAKLELTYRFAVVSDIPEIAKVCFDYFPELDVGMPESKLDKEAVVDHLFSCIGPDKPPMILAEDGEAIVGLYGLDLDRYWWMDKYHITDYIWYVKPAYRKENIGSALRQRAEVWCRTKGLQFRPTGINIDRLPAKDRAFQMAGYSRVGSVYSKIMYNNK